MNRFWNTLKEHGIFLILAGILCVYFAAICLINFSGRPSFYCTDMYTDILFARKAWESGSLIPEGWLFGNQLYVVATPALAALFCAVTENPQIAMAFAAVTMTVLILTAFWWLLRAVFSGREERLLCVVLFMALGLYFGDSVGTANGWQLFFTMCAYYGCYLLNLLLAFGCYLRADEEHDWKFYAVLLLTCGLSFGTGIQSLRQTAIMTLPLLAMAFVQLLQDLHRKETWKRHSFLAAAAISLANVGGLLFQRTIEFEQTEIFGTMGLTPAGQLLPAVKESLCTMLELLHCETAGASVMRFAIVAVSVLTAAALGFQEKDPKKRRLAILLVLSILAILAVDVLTTMEVRSIYYFVIYFWMAFLGAYGYSKGKNLLRWLLLMAATLTLVLPGMLALKDVCMQAYFAKYDRIHEVSGFLLETDYDTVYAPWNLGEDIAIASDGQIRVGFWDEEMLVPVMYLCDPAIYEADSSRCVYALFGAEGAQQAELAASAAGAELTLLQYFSESNVYLYTSAVNLMQRHME